MDTRFDSLITPKLIRFLYVVSIVVLAIGTLVTIVAAFTDKASTGILVLVFAPLVALIYLIVVRLWLELIVVTFKIREAADQIAGNTRQPTA
jgi:ABC-type multidrug transport system permease subunit